MPEHRVELFRQAGPTTVAIDAEINGAGDLVISGQDIGDAPRAAFGEDDYEYWLTVAAADKDVLLLALLVKLYGGDGLVVTRLRELLDEAVIPFRFSTF